MVAESMLVEGEEVQEGCVDEVLGGGSIIIKARQMAQTERSEIDETSALCAITAVEAFLRRF
jgi:hypothetical protein